MERTSSPGGPAPSAGRPAPSGYDERPAARRAPTASSDTVPMRSPVSPTPPSLLAPPLRTQVRDAVERAWHAAVASGALPAVDADVVLPAIEVERPSNPEHGD